MSNWKIYSILVKIAKQNKLLYITCSSNVQCSKMAEKSSNEHDKLYL